MEIGIKKLLMAEIVYFKEWGDRAFNVCFVHYALQARVSLPTKASSVIATSACGGLRCFVCWRLEILSVQGNKV